MRVTLLTRMAEQLVGYSGTDISATARARLALALTDFLGCAAEVADGDLATSAFSIARPLPNGSPIVARPGSWDGEDAAFINALMGHALVREDMHAGSIAHWGVVVWPIILASLQGGARIHDVPAAALCGYEIGTRLGAALFSNGLAALMRPTGVVGPLVAAAVRGRLMGFDQARMTAALGLAANMASGLNEWPATGGDEMYCHPGIAARSGLLACRLAGAGLKPSLDVIEGKAGLFAALARSTAPASIQLFAAEKTGLEEIFHKDLPLCNFAQSPTQAALDVAAALEPGALAQCIRIEIATTAAGLAYPGCAGKGPFANRLQAKMSIFHCVASALRDGKVDEASFDQLARLEIIDLISRMHVVEDPAMTRAFPARQGARVTVVFENGQELTRQRDEIEPATPERINTRLHAAFGTRAPMVEQAIATLASGGDPFVLASAIAA